MSNAKEPFHCDKCGFCRVGGRDNYIHCDKCSMCIEKTAFEKNGHMCLKDNFNDVCSICYEDMYSSRQACRILKCGHPFHEHCIQAWMSAKLNDCLDDKVSYCII